MSQRSGTWRGRPPIIRLAALIGLALLAHDAGAQDVRERVSFYFAAHEDDWQLFMNPSAFADVTDGRTRTVFVHVTAGDAGLGVGTGGRKHPYYLARENGAETAIRFMADADDQPAARVAARVDVAGHRVYRVAYRQTAAYFLKLPDGHPSGSGFPRTAYQSLKRLAQGEIGVISAIDGSTAYVGWTDLVATLRAIVERERGGARAVQLNVAEQDAGINPNDHSDHRMTAKAALEAAKDLACARRVHYVDYANARRAENLSAEEREMQSSVLAVTAAGILAFDHGSIWQRYHRSYLGRSYFRVEEGAGPCAEPESAAPTVVSQRPGRR